VRSHSAGTKEDKWVFRSCLWQMRQLSSPIAVVEGESAPLWKPCLCFAERVRAFVGPWIVSA